jgi:hypothetical protein
LGVGGGGARPPTPHIVRKTMFPGQTDS